MCFTFLESLLNAIVTEKREETLNEETVSNLGFLKD